MSEKVYIKCRFKWFRHTATDPWGNWKTEVYPIDDTELEKFKTLQTEGVKNTLKKDEEGYNFTARRPREKKMRDGRMVGYTPPMVLDGTKPLPGGGFAPLDSSINVGNGSTGELKLEVYQYTNPMTKKKEKAIRWESARIDNLIPFESKDFVKDEQKAVIGLETAPPQQLW